MSNIMPGSPVVVLQTKSTSMVGYQKCPNEISSQPVFDGKKKRQAFLKIISTQNRRKKWLETFLYAAVALF
jgi:hypothetical protein